MSDAKTTNGALEWTIVVKKNRPEGVPDNNVGYLKRGDLTIESIGFSREFRETFLCKGMFGQFTFEASRWDDDKDKPTEQYIVLFFWPYIEKGKEALVLSMVKDIESALLRYPIHAVFHNIPVKRVLFQMGMARSPSTLKHAMELQQG